MRKYSLRFAWTKLHKQPSELEPLRSIGDPLVDEVLPLVSSGDVIEVRPQTTTRSVRLDCDFGRACRICFGSGVNPEFRNSWHRSNLCRLGWTGTVWSVANVCLCAWADLQVLVVPSLLPYFTRYCAALILFNLSLVGGYIAPRINKVLKSTGRILLLPSGLS